MNILVSMFQIGLNSLQKLESRAMRRREAYASISDIDLVQYNQNVLNNNPFTVFDTYEAFRVYRNQLMMQQMTGQELAMLIKEEEEDFIINNTELNINCCIMMLDMVFKQFNIQRISPNLGIFNQASKDILLLMSKQLILPWAKKHRCKHPFGFLSADSITTSTVAGASGVGVTVTTSGPGVPASNPTCCQFCEEHVLWFTFAKDILVYISPKQEIDLPEINFNHVLDSLVMPGSHSSPQRNNPNPGGGNVTDGGGDGVYSGATSDDEAKRQQSQTPKKAESKTDPDVGIWVTSDGVYYFKFAQLSHHLQLFYSMLKELYRVPDIDAFSNLIQCIKMLVIHCDCLELANKEQKGFLIYTLEKMLVPRYSKFVIFVHNNKGLLKPAIMLI